jgi:hypothetical protein
VCLGVPDSALPRLESRGPPDDVAVSLGGNR